MQIPVGSTLHHRYEILKPLGTGGMGTAYLVEDLVRGGQLALKALHQHAINFLPAFREEFAVLAGRLHPHLGRVHDFGATRWDGSSALYYYTADYINGTNLHQFASDHAYKPILSALFDALSGLAFLHQLGIRHGDFKPSNIMVDERGRGVLIDLSCCRPLGAPPAASVSGTPGFIAPELEKQGTADHRADLFAVGITLQRIIARCPKKPPKRLMAAIARLTAPDPADRPSDVAETLEELGAHRILSNIRPVPLARLVGRDPQMALFSDALEALLSNQPGTRGLCIVGPEGIGRSRLLQEMKWSAQLRCDVVEGDASVPLPIASLLRRAATQHPWNEQLDDVLRARDALVEAARPVVLTLDDAHWLSEGQQRLLHALARSLSPTDPILLVWAEPKQPPVESDACRMCMLEPLTGADLATWAGGRLPSHRVDDVLAFTGGFPASFQPVFAQLAHGELTEDDLQRIAGQSPLSERRIERVRSMSPADRRALCSFAVLEGCLHLEEMASMGVGATELSTLVEGVWIQPEAAGWKLVRAGEAPSILEASEPALVIELHRRAADRIEQALTAAGHSPSSDTSESMPVEVEQTISARTANLVFHRAKGQQLDEATFWLMRSEGLYRAHPHGWPRAVDAIIELRDAPDLLVVAAEILELSGHPERGLSLLEPLVDGAASASMRPLVLERIATCCLKLGDIRRAKELLDVAGREATLADDVRARLADQLSRIHIKSSAYDAAVSCARVALTLTDDSATLANLHDDVGVAASYLGDTSLAREHLEKAAALHDAVGAPRARVRSISYQAFNEYRSGNTEGATEGYRRALELSERHGLADQIAHAALNVGTACHQRGDWGEALALYERGLRSATALGQVSAELTLEFNLAKLHADLGLFDRAASGAARAEDRARARGLRFLSSAAQTVRGEVALAKRQLDDAASILTEARDGFIADGAQREGVEVELSLCEILLASRDLPAASRSLARAIESGHGLSADDLDARVACLQASLHLARGELSSARDRLEVATQLAQKVRQRALQAEIEGTFADVAERLGDPAEARRHRHLAMSHWQSVVGTLPDHLREVFWKHFRRVEVGRKPLVDAAPKPPDAITVQYHDRSWRLHRLLDINMHINSSLSAREVLNRAIDAAIELTGADRGFLVLAPEDSSVPQRFDVAVARNLDHGQVGNPQFKVSRGICEHAIRLGEVILTSEAGTDGRFADAQSVHALQLKSVAAVPIRSPQGTLGALYLDHRFEAGRFQPEDRQLLLAFANQVAIALTNARLHDQLKTRTQELEQERQRVEELVRNQAQEITRLNIEVQNKQEILEHRYDYSNIVGRGPAMQRLFAALDRVIGSTVSVLIEGESGTGKELIARAIHFNGPRHDKPFMTINCGAIPESLLESELFGHVRGAFTGADRAREGLLQAAQGGTVFLDEIGEMSMGMQVKLLRVLQEREVRPVGASKSVPIDIRLLSATNRSLEREVEAGRFRSDLFYRINVVELCVPPLRQRPEDIPELTHRILQRVAKEQGGQPPKVEPKALRTLSQHSWPGNVRELENVLTQACLMSEGARIGLDDLALKRERPPLRVRTRTAYQQAEAEQILAALHGQRWNITAVSRALAIPRASLYRKMRRYGFSREEPDSE
jgi:transcriptional regulator with GAF, ATPase, and Fis domain/tetratricopeptide (TPR) repeat protein